MSDAPQHIIRLLNEGAIGEAEAMLEANGGPLFGFVHGYEALGRLIMSATEEALNNNQMLLSCYCFSLVKAGRARRASALLASKREIYQSVFLRDLMELVVFIHMSDPVTEEQFERWKHLEVLLPIDQPLYDGLYYNCMAIVLVRLNRLAQARIIALRSLESYRQAKHTALEFFIHLHLAHIDVLEGNIRSAHRATDMARAMLAEEDAAHISGAALVEILDCAIAWETGRFDFVPDRVVYLRRQLLSGDSWAEIFVELCRIGALSIYFARGLESAMAFLEDSQTDFHRRHGEFSEALDVIGAAVELLDGRHERAQLYTTISETSRKALGATGSIVLGGVLGKLESDTEWLPAPDAGVSTRHAVLGELSKATQAKLERDKVRQRRHVQNAMRLAVQEGLVGLFLEHRDLVIGVSSQLASGKFARGHIQLGRMARRIHKLVRTSYLTPASLSDRGVSAQQLRVLSALREGASNKQIARKLGLSEAAIKYHLGRLFVSFEVSKRGQLIEKFEESINS